MGASDNLMAGASGALDVAKYYFMKKFESGLRKDEKTQDYMDELNMYKNKLPLEEASKIRVTQAKPRDTWIISPEAGTTLAPGQRPFNLPVPKIEKKAKEIITSEQAQKLRDAGIKVTDVDYTIHDAPGTKTQKSATIQKDVSLLKSSLKSFDKLMTDYDKARGNSGQIEGAVKSIGSALTKGYVAPESKVYKDRLGGYVETLTKQMTGTSRNTQMVLQKAIQEFPELSENRQSADLKRAGTRQLIIDRISELQGKPFEESDISDVSDLLPNASNSTATTPIVSQPSVTQSDLQEGKSFGGGKIKSVRWK
jgi:hypothetical protein